MSPRRFRAARRRPSEPLPTAFRGQWPAFAMTGGLALTFFLLLGQPVLKRVLVILFLSVLLAYLISPAVEAIRRRVTVGRRARPISVGAAIGLVYAVLGGTVAIVWLLAGDALARSARALRHAAPDAIATAARRVEAVEGLLERVPGWEHVEATVGRAAASLSRDIERQAIGAVSQLDHGGEFLPWLAAAPVVAFLLLRHSRLFRRSSLRALPRTHLQWRAGEFLSDVNAALAAFVRASLIAALIIGAACTAGFALLRVPGAALLGLAAGLLELLPVLGPLTVAVVATNGLSAKHALAVLVFLGALRVAQDYWIYPRLIQRRLRLNVVLVIAAILIGAELGGIAGVFIAVPVLAMLSVSLRHWREHREIEEFVRVYGRRTPEPATAGLPLPAPADTTSKAAGSAP
jgi:predicted PurR-regulated permease PerM